MDMHNVADLEAVIRQAQWVARTSDDPDRIVIAKAVAFLVGKVREYGTAREEEFTRGALAVVLGMLALNEMDENDEMDLDLEV